MKCAISNVEAQERAAQRAAMCKWTEWIHDGPASGLRRQHLFSRGCDGWTPTKPGSGSYEPINPEDELDDIEGLSREDLDALRFEQCIGNPPASAQQQADDEAERWQELGKGLKLKDMQWPDDMGVTFLQSCGTN